MSFSAKKFLQQYGSAGVIAYGGVTIMSVTSIYLGLRSGVDIVRPVEACLGTDSDFVKTLRAQLRDGESSSVESTRSTATITNDANNKTAATVLTNNNNNNNNNTPNNTKDSDSNKGGINWAREGTYLGIAGALDSFVLPAKLMVCLPLARKIISFRKGGR